MKQNNPEGWKDTTLGEIACFRNGSSSPERSNKGKYYVYGANGIIGMADEFNSIEKCIIIGRVGSYCGSIYFSDFKCWVTDNAIICNSQNNSDPVFLKNILQTLKLNSRSSGSGQPLINQELLKKIDIKIPQSIEEQRSIASILSSLDDKIELLQKENKTLEAIAQNIFKRWFVDFEFPYDFSSGKPDPKGKPYKSSGGKMINSELGKIPEGWRVGKIKDEFTIVMGQSPPGDSYNIENRGMIFFQGNTDFDFRFPRVRLYTDQPTKKVNEMDTLVSVRAPVGEINMASVSCCIGRGLSAIQSEYKSYCFYKIHSIKNLFMKFESEGTVFGSMSKEGLENIQTIIPDEKMKKFFQNIILNIDQKIINNTQKNQIILNIRDTLLPKLMSGKIRVKI